MYFNWKRYLVSLLIIIAADYAFSYLLINVFHVVNYLMYYIAISLVMAFVIALINYPWYYRKDFLKDPGFHKSFAILFIILFVINYFL